MKRKNLLSALFLLSLTVVGCDGSEQEKANKNETINLTAEQGKALVKEISDTNSDSFKETMDGDFIAATLKFAAEGKVEIYGSNKKEATKKIQDQIASYKGGAELQSSIDLAGIKKVDTDGTADFSKTENYAKVYADYDYSNTDLKGTTTTEKESETLEYYQKGLDIISKDTIVKNEKEEVDYDKSTIDDDTADMIGTYANMGLNLIQDFDKTVKDFIDSNLDDDDGEGESVGEEEEEENSYNDMYERLKSSFSSYLNDEMTAETFLTQADATIFDGVLFESIGGATSKTVCANVLDGIFKADYYKYFTYTQYITGDVYDLELNLDYSALKDYLSKVFQDAVDSLKPTDAIYTIADAVNGYVQDLLPDTVTFKCVASIDSEGILVGASTEYALAGGFTRDIAEVVSSMLDLSITIDDTIEDLNYDISGKASIEMSYGTTAITVTSLSVPADYKKEEDSSSAEAKESE